MGTEYYWDKFLNTSNLTARIYRVNEQGNLSDKPICRGFITDMPELSMELTWSKSSGGLFNEFLSDLMKEMEKAKQDYSSLVTGLGGLASLVPKTGVGEATGNAVKSLNITQTTEMCQSELYSSFQGYSSDISIPIEVIFITDDDSQNNSSYQKCKECLDHFVPKVTSAANVLWTVKSNVKEQKINATKSGSIGITNAFAVLVGGYGEGDKEGYVEKYENLVVSKISVEKSDTLVVNSSGQTYPLYIKLKITFDRISVVRPEEFSTLMKL